jgi:hypothetical protein
VTWFRIEGKMPQHVKYAPLTDTAFRLAITAGCWCSENMTDGLIPKAMVAVLTAAPRGKKLTDSVGSLVRAGIWEERGEHWYLHDFLDWNMSREQWLKRLAAASAGGNAKAARSASKSAPHSTPPPLANVCHVADQVECQTAAKTLPGGLPCALPDSESDSESDPDLSAAASQRPDKLGKNEANRPDAAAAAAGKSGGNREPLPRPAPTAALPPRVIRAATDLSTTPLDQLARVCRENPRNAEFMDIQGIAAVRQIHESWCRAVGRTVRPLGTLTERNRQLWAILTALESYSLQDVLRACEQASRDDWCRGRKPNRDGTPGKPHGVEDMSPTVLRELLDASDAARPTALNPRVSAMLAEEDRREAERLARTSVGGAR